ncbi:hypothetical protein V6N13_026540 [Hibiscus sabdariffa]
MTGKPGWAVGPFLVRQSFRSLALKPLRWVVSHQGAVVTGCCSGDKSMLGCCYGREEGCPTWSKHGPWVQGQLLVVLVDLEWARAPFIQL